MGTSSVGARVARRRATYEMSLRRTVRLTRARSPVDVVDLEETNIITSVGVMVYSVTVATRFVLSNAAAAVLGPVAVPEE